MGSRTWTRRDAASAFADYTSSTSDGITSPTGARSNTASIGSLDTHYGPDASSSAAAGGQTAKDTTGAVSVIW